MRLRAYARELVWRAADAESSWEVRAEYRGNGSVAVCNVLRDGRRMATYTSGDEVAWLRAVPDHISKAMFQHGPTGRPPQWECHFGGGDRPSHLSVVVRKAPGGYSGVATWETRHDRRRFVGRAEDESVRDAAELAVSDIQAPRCWEFARWQADHPPFHVSPSRVDW